jgi:Carboxypeptidase regulatory-like domain
VKSSERWGVVTLLVLLALARLDAQGGPTSGEIMGTVRDESAAPIEKAIVEAISRETGMTRTVSTSASGQFVIAALPIGLYDVRAADPRFAPRTLASVLVQLGSSVSLDFRLRLNGIQEQISVTDNPAAEFAVPSPTRTVIAQDHIDVLPTNGRNFIGFAQLTPAVAPDRTPQQGASRTSGLTMVGQRARSNNITVDGLDNNDETVGSVRALFSQEAVKEFQVSAGGFDAEFGKASGGVVNIVTKSGANMFGGGGFIFLRDDSLDAKGYFERFDPSGMAIVQDKAPYTQKQFGGIFGGPFKKDRAFLFTSFERLATHASNFVTIDDRTLITHPLNPAVSLGTPAQILRTAGFPVEAGNVPYAIDLNQLLAKVDVQLPSSQTLTIRVNTATELNENIEPFGGQIARSRGAALDSTDVMTAVTDTVVLTPNVLNELRAQAAVRYQVVRSLDSACVGQCRDELQGGPTLDVGGIASVGRQRFTPTYRDNVRYQIVDALTIVRGRHQFKTGIDASLIRGLRQSLPLYFGGRYIFQDAALPLVPGLPPVAVSSIQEVALGLPLAYVQGYGRSGESYNTADASVFLQDRWTPRDTLAVNAGVRYQRQFWPRALYQPTGSAEPYGFASDGNNLAPRVSLTWRPLASRPFRLQGGYGMYFDNLISSIYGITRYVNGADGVRVLVLRAPAAFSAWGAAGHRLDEATARQLSGGTYPSVAITPDPSLKTPYAHHLNVVGTSRLSNGLTLGVEAIYVRGFDHPGTIDYNPLVPELGAGRRPADLGGVAGTSASVLQYTSFGETWYRALTASLDARWRSDSWLLFSSPLSKAEDNSTDFQSAFLPQDNGRGRNPGQPNGLPAGFDAAKEQGASLQDQRHRFVASGTCVLPSDVQITAIVTMGSGRPFNILAGADLNGDGDGGNPASDRARSVLTDPTASLPRNSGRLPWQATLDVRISRRFEARHLTIAPAIDIFNLLNTTNFTEVQNVFGTGSYPRAPLPTFGRFTQSGPPRQVQLGVKVGF